MDVGDTQAPLTQSTEAEVDVAPAYLKPVLTGTYSRPRHERMAIARSKGRHTQLEWRAMVEFFENRCVHCGSDEWFIERDHVLPVYQGGDDSIRNLQPSCAWCNARRGPDNTDKRPAFAARLGKQMPPEWMAI